MKPECGADFMAGTICSLAPGHAGPHAATCQTCGGDWISQTCTCMAYCAGCGSRHPVDDVTPFCEDCRCHNGQHGQCVLFWDHLNPSESGSNADPMPCHVVPVPDFQPVSIEEVAELFGVDPSLVPPF